VIQYQMKMLFLLLYAQKHTVQYAHFVSHLKRELTLLPLHDMPTLFPINWAAIQRRGSKLAWIIILYVYGADTIAEVKLFMKSINGFLNNFNFHAIISTLLIINLH
jgi:hypothetical protein